MGRTLIGSEAGLILYWTFDEGSTDLIYDHTPNANVGFRLGAPAYSDSAAPLTRTFVITDFASQITASSAVLKGRVSPVTPNSLVYFDWGDTTNVSTRTPVQILGGADLEVIAAPLTHLRPGSVYYFRLGVVTPDGTRSLGDLQALGTLITGVPRALYLPGTGSYAISPDLSRWLSDENITIELWFKSHEGGVIIDERGQLPPNAGWQYSFLEMIPGGLLRMRVYPLSAVDLGTATLDQWHHAAIRYDKAARRLDGFLDGIKVPGPVGDRLIPLRSGYHPFYAIGLADPANMGNGSSFYGNIDEVRIWSVARTDLEITINRFRRLESGVPGLIASWRFDESEGTTAFDSSGFGNNATLSLSASRVQQTAPTYAFQQIVQSTNSSIHLQFLGDPGTTVRLELSTDLIHWSPVMTNVVPANNLFEVDDVLNQSSRFYRLRAP